MRALVLVGKRRYRGKTGYGFQRSKVSYRDRYVYVCAYGIEMKVSL